MLVLISHEYDNRGAEGICTTRLVKALRAQYADVSVITRLNNKSDDQHLTERIPVFTSRPSRVQMLLGALLIGAPVSGWDWAIRTSWKPVSKQCVIYGRGNPLVSLVAAYRLAQRTSRPLITHFSDPIPDPWYDTHSMLFKKTLKVVRPILNASCLVTFTTHQAIEYMNDLYKINLTGKSLVLRNIVPDWPTPPLTTDHIEQVVHVGNFGGQRLPDPLAHGVTVYNSRNEHRQLKLTLVGARPYWYDYIRARYPTLPLEMLPRTDSVLPYYFNSAVTAVVDANDDEPVFLATKAAESIQAANRVLFISPKGSPARCLFEDRWRSVRFSHYDPNVTSDVLSDLIEITNPEIRSEITSRRAALTDFNSDIVARVLLDRLCSMNLLPELCLS